MSVSEAFEVVLLDEKTLDEIEEPVKDFEILDLNAANANDSGNSGKNAIGQAHDMFSRVFQNANLLRKGIYMTCPTIKFVRKLSADAHS
jgi:hypothetical protein